ncbi:MAG: metallophosphoesterase [Candidatus Tectimicrobiota bacterium]
MRIAFTSDLHTDHHAANRAVWEAMVAHLHELEPDVFICCGDVAADETRFGMTLMALEQVACPKLLVPGNHDVWLQNPAWVQRGITSQHKYYRLLPALCREAGVHPLWLTPYVLDDVAFCGSLGWYDYSLRNEVFDTQLSLPDYHRKRFQAQHCNDRQFAHWLAPATPERPARRLSDAAVTTHMVRELTQQIQAVPAHVRQVVGVTHMLPFRAMMQYRQEVQRDYFAAFMGSTRLGETWRACEKIALVLAGHTHRQMTVQLGALQAMTSPVGYRHQWEGKTPVTVARERLRCVELGTGEQDCLVPWSRPQD